MSSNSNHKVVIVGKSGNGKSSLGNILLNRRSFDEGDGFDAVTLRSQLGANAGGLTVADTPGLFDTRDDPKKVVNGALEIIRALDLCPEPHAFLIVFNGACRLTEEEMSVTYILRLSFGNEWIKHGIVVITHIDNDVKDSTFEKKWKSCEKLRNLVRECGGRVVRINNKNPRQEHIKKIRRDIEQVSNNGKLSYKYSYLECNIKVLRNATELETYNGMTTFQLLERLARDINDKVVEKEKERQAAKAESNRYKKIRIFVSATVGLAAGLGIARITRAAPVTTPIVIAGSIVSVLTHYFIT